jgi:hypothetical protein
MSSRIIAEDSGILMDLQNSPAKREKICLTYYKIIKLQRNLILCNVRDSRNPITRYGTECCSRVLHGPPVLRKPIHIYIWALG